MCSESMKLPVIDFCNLKKDTPQWRTVKEQVRQALEDYGCFEASFDKVPQTLRNSTYDGVRQLFDLPLEDKSRNKAGKFASGYVPFTSSPLFETLSIDYSHKPGCFESFVNLLWPEGDHHLLSKSIESYLDQLYKLDHTVRRMVLESLGLEKYIDEHLNIGKYVVAFMKYKGPKSNGIKNGLAAHLDSSIVTILSQKDVNGLEVLSKDGKQWIPAQPSSSSFIVLVGESLYAWTNGRVHCPLHRVMITGDKDRYSIGQFSVFKEGYMITAPQEMVDEEHPLLFKPFDYHEFRKFYYSTQIDEKPRATIKSYCEV